MATSVDVERDSAPVVRRVRRSPKTVTSPCDCTCAPSAIDAFDVAWCSVHTMAPEMLTLPSLITGNRKLVIVPLFSAPVLLTAPIAEVAAWVWMPEILFWNCIARVSLPIDAAVAVAALRSPSRSAWTVISPLVAVARPARMASFVS